MSPEPDPGEPDVDIEAACRKFDLRPLDHPARAALAFTLLQMLVMNGIAFRPDWVERAVAFGEIAAREPNPPKDLPHWRALARAAALASQVALGDQPVTPRQALAEIGELRSMIGGTEPFATVLGVYESALTVMRAILDEDLESIGGIDRTVDGLADLAAAAGVPANLDFVRLMAKILAASLTDNWAEVWTLLERLENLLEHAPDDDSMTREVAALVTAAPLLRGGIDPAAPPLDADEVVRRLDRLRASTSAPDLPDPIRALMHSMYGTAQMAAGRAHLDQAVETLREAVRLASSHDPRLPHHYCVLGEALVERYQAQHCRPDLTDAIEALEKSIAYAGSPAHRYWSVASLSLATAYRFDGRKALAREVARRGLRGRAWSVVLQANTHLAAAAARNAGAYAIDVARWYLEDGDAEGAVATLDAGRGLILYAASEVREVAERLEQIGEADLASEWRESVATRDPEELPTDLRRRVLSAVVGVPFDAQVGAPMPAGTPPDPQHASRLLDPTSVDEIRRALRAADSDALIYLVSSGGNNARGMAVVIPAAEPATHLWLPKLAVGSDDHLDGFLAATARDGSALDRDVGARLRATVHNVSGWAWEAAIGPLLNSIGPRADGQPPRLVLVPMGTLARIPWHAARGPGVDAEYAIERAAFSYTASARLFCDTAWRERTAIGTAGLVIGDPDTGGQGPDLAGARAEALAIHEAFYPDGCYLGRRSDGTTAPDGEADRKGILDRLTDGTLGAMLHLACHGVVQAGSRAGDSSYLLLAGGQRFAAEDLVRTLTRRPAQGVELAVLAACSSGVSGRGYDEAFSLATALLVSGVRSVISTLWSVPDGVTSVLMYLFHHHIRVDGMPPRHALRAAQLWMLDPNRRLPAGMPSPLRELVARTDPAELAAWAGFVHQGL